MKPGKAAGPSEVYAEMISAGGEVRIGVMVQPYQRAQDECQTSGWSQFSKEKEIWEATMLTEE